MAKTRGIGRLTATVAGLSAVLALGACGADDSDENTEATTTNEATDTFPVSIEHAFGTTEIDEEPTRVATWGWGSTEAAIAVGVYPVAVAEQTYTVGEGNLLPWVEEAYDEAGVEHPAVLTDAAGGAEVPYDEFIAAEPDLILAPYSGLTQEQYEELTKIADVVAYPEAPWTTPWDDNIEITAEALGRSDDGEQVLEDIDAGLEAQAEEHPEFEGQTIAAVYPSPNGVSVYTELDPRAEILTELGFETAPSVGALDTSDGGFYYDLSFESVDELDADVLVAYFATQEEADAFMVDKKAQAIPAVAAGKVAAVVTPPAISAVSPPTALSFDWEGGMPALVDELATVAAE